jgi:uncharacterized membrane protein YuzA (DUF378 family)
MRKLFTVVFLLTVLGCLNWSLESVGYNPVSALFSDKKGVLQKTGHIIYFMFAFCGLLSLILYVREGMYKEKEIQDIK